MTEASRILDSVLKAELTDAVDERVTLFVQRFIGVLQPLAVLFYGSGLRRFDPQGLLDFYVILEKLEDWPTSRTLCTLNRLLPPNVFFAAYEINGTPLRAKIAVVSLEQLQRLTTPHARDISFWARFCQPTRLVWVRHAQAADAVLGVLRQSVVTAAGWAARLQSGAQNPELWWAGLFTQTYRAELRVEKENRPLILIQGYEKRYAALLLSAWEAGGLTYRCNGDKVSPIVARRQRTRAERRWEKLAACGRWRNVLRLLKAAFTFQNGASYLAWKIERHTGYVLKMSHFEARHPLLCLPRLLWRTRRIFLKSLRGGSRPR